MNSCPRLRRGTIALAACLAAFVGAATFATAAESPDEMRQRRREVQAEAAEVGSQVDTLTEDADELTDALQALRDSVDAQQAALDAAERRVTAAEAAEAAAEQAIVDLRGEIDATESLLRSSAVDSFMGFQGPNSDNAALTENPWQYARVESLIQFGTGSTTEIIDHLQFLAAELEGEERAAAENTADVQAQRAEVAARKTELDAAVVREQEALAAVEARLDARLAEVASLKALDAELAGKIQAEEQRIAEAIAARNRAAQAKASSGASSGSSGGTVNVPSNAPVSLTTVRGIVVNSAIAGTIEGFLGAMESRGYTLGGGGYRSSDSQVSLRRSHCGSSDYAIWEMPSYQCSPPTARPGQSAHERGLAVDFTYQGSIIRSRSSDVFQVMAQVAPSFGLVNLPSEPWHWSTTGT